jgi:hypothetical protein
MKIDKNLIERYHRQECSAEEREAVESWLFSADSEEALQLPLSESKAAHKADIWAGIAEILPAGSKTDEIPEIQQPQPKRKILKASFWSGAVAASITIALLTFGGYYYFSAPQEQEYDQFVSINNPSSVNVRHVESSGYAISVGTNTSAHIDGLSGTVDLSGSMLIRPKKDIELKFKGSPDKTILKKGQTYIILKGRDGNDKIIVLSEKNIINLPPVLQKQIINEFDI